MRGQLAQPLEAQLDSYKTQFQTCELDALRVAATFQRPSYTATKPEASDSMTRGPRGCKGGGRQTQTAAGETLTL